MSENKKLFSLFLIATAFFCGAMIMVIEVLGSRVIGPFFGVSIFVWTSLITVTMIALAAGYAIGGWFSDRKDHPDWLYGLITAAGVLTLLVPLLKGPILKLCMTFGLRTGAFASSLILFGPPLLLLGCVSPFLIRIAARELASIGRTVGSFYAVSTVGSVVGTVATGFFLISWLGVNQIFFLVGVALILLGIAYFAFFRGRYAVVLLLLITPISLPGEAAIDKVMENGTNVRLVKKLEGFYGEKKVVDYSYGVIHTRELMIDSVIQGGIDMRTGEAIYPYYYVLGTVPQTIHPQGKNCLVIGLGAGLIPPFYTRNGIRTDVIDIDEDIVTLARDYFNFAGAERVVIEDARYFLNRGTELYDYMILDVFSGETVPAHMLSREAFALMRKRLAPGGVLAINLTGSLERNSFMTASVLKTLHEIFPQVDIYPNFDPQAAGAVGNISLFAHDGEPCRLPPDYFRRMKVHPFVAKELADIPRWRYELPPAAEALVLTDEYNPVDCHDLELKETIRRNLLATTDWDVLVK